MRVLRATGFIGSNLLSRLQSSRTDLEIRAITRDAQKLRKNLEDWKVEIVETDVKNFPSLKNALIDCEVA